MVVLSVVLRLEIFKVLRVGFFLAVVEAVLQVACVTVKRLYGKE